MGRMLLVALSAMFLATLHRLRHGPSAPGWSWTLEWLVADCRPCSYRWARPSACTTTCCSSRRSSVCLRARTLSEYPGMPHVWHLFRLFVPQAVRAIEEVVGFIRDHTSGRSPVPLSPRASPGRA
jgi:hypothetical protein